MDKEEKIKKFYYIMSAILSVIAIILFYLFGADMIKETNISKCGFMSICVLCMIFNELYMQKRKKYPIKNVYIYIIVELVVSIIAGVLVCLNILDFLISLAIVICITFIYSVYRHFAYKKMIAKSTDGFEKDTWKPFIENIVVLSNDMIDEIQKNAVLTYLYDKEMHSGGFSYFIADYPDISIDELIGALENIGADDYMDNLKIEVENQDDPDFDDNFYDIQPELIELIKNYVKLHSENILNIKGNTEDNI
jgi:hypothetical protein